MTQATVQNAQQKINDLISENTALRERMKRMEEALKSIADYLTYDAQDLRDMAGAALKGGGE